MDILTKFTTKKGRTIEVVEPSLDLLDEILEFANKLTAEDTFLTFDPGKKILKEDEKKWLENNLTNIANGKTVLLWAYFDGKIVGSVDVNRGLSVRDYHIGAIGLMIDKDFRGEGIGKFLLKMIIEKAKQMGLRTLVLDVFSDNIAAINLYQKMGFKEWGRLPDGLYRQKKFSDKIEMYLELI